MKNHTVAVIVAGALAFPPWDTTQASQQSARGAAAAASIQDVMQLFVDPAADALWDSVSTTSTAQGVEEKRPQSDADWEEQRKLALRLVEASNLLLLPGRPVADPGRPIEDSHLAAVLPAAAIEARIRKAPARFAQRARDLQAAGLQALAAARSRNVDALVRAGSALDEACEACHLAYWYPGGGPPPATKIER
jgi:hypothetical protein